MSRTSLSRHHSASSDDDDDDEEEMSPHRPQSVINTARFGVPATARTVSVDSSSCPPMVMSCSAVVLGGSEEEEEDEEDDDNDDAESETVCFKAKMCLGCL